MDPAALDTTQPDVLIFVIACGLLCLAAGIIWGYAWCRGVTDRKVRKWLRQYKPDQYKPQPVNEKVRVVGEISKPIRAWRMYV